MNLEKIYTTYPTNFECIKRLEELKWNSSPICPYCKSNKYTSIKETVRYKCNKCNTSYSVTVGTIFHKTKIDLQKWFYTINVFAEEPKSISVRKLAKEINVNNNTACLMLMRLRNKEFREFSNVLKN